MARVLRALWAGVSRLAVPTSPDRDFRAHAFSPCGTSAALLWKDQLLVYKVGGLYVELHRSLDLSKSPQHCAFRVKTCDCASHAAEVDLHLSRQGALCLETPGARALLFCPPIGRGPSPSTRSGVSKTPPRTTSRFTARGWGLVTMTLHEKGCTATRMDLDVEVDEDWEDCEGSRLHKEFAGSFSSFDDVPLGDWAGQEVLPPLLTSPSPYGGKLTMESPSRGNVDIVNTSRYGTRKARVVQDGVPVTEDRAYFV